MAYRATVDILERTSQCDMTLNAKWLEAKYDKNWKMIREPKMIRPEQVIWPKSIKNYKTVYAICTYIDKTVHGKALSYTLQDFSGKVMKVEPSQLYYAMGTNRIDVVNIELEINNSNCVLPEGVREGKILNVNSFENMDEDTFDKLLDANNIDTYDKHGNAYKIAIGNPNIGYIVIERRYGSFRAVDYKGYCKELTLPKVKSIEDRFLSFNDYVEVLNIPETCKDRISIDIGYGATALKLIRYNISSKDVLNLKLSGGYLDKTVYQDMSSRNDIQIQFPLAPHLNMGTADFVELLGSRSNLATKLKITQESVDTDDQLQKYIMKTAMIGDKRFIIDIQKRMLMASNLSGNIDTLKLPPVDDIGYDWYMSMLPMNGNCHINTLYFPDTLKNIAETIDKSVIPVGIRNGYYKSYGYKGRNQAYITEYERLVDKIVIPGKLNIKHVWGVAATTGIIYETKYGTGTADQISTGSGTSGIALTVIDIIQHTDKKTVVIEDKYKNRKVVTESALITVVEDGKAHLTNAIILFNRTIRVVKSNK